MATSVQNRNNRWQLRVKHKLLFKPYIDTFDDEASARKYGAQLVAQLDRGKVPIELMPAGQPAHTRGSSVQNVAMTAVILDYLNKEQSVSKSEADVLQALMPDLQTTQVLQVNYQWANTFVQRLKVERRLAPGTIRKKVQALARVYEHWRHSHGHSELANPFHSLNTGYSSYGESVRGLLKTGEAVPIDVKRDRRLHPGEFEAIEKCMDQDLRDLFLLLVKTGLRLREAYGLECAHVDLSSNVINVRCSKLRNGQIKYRSVPIQPALKSMLSRRLAMGKRKLLFSFWSGKAGDLKSTTERLSEVFTRAFKAAGAKDLRAHDLRHEATCQWLEMRDRKTKKWLYNEVEVSRIMGWNNLSMMLRYASIRASDLSQRMY